MLKRVTLSRPDMHALVHWIGKVFIIAHRESTEALEAVLAQEGLDVEVLRQVDQPEYQSYAAIHRCMLNHQRAWKRTAQMQQPALILEADFVPVKGLGQLPMPFAIHQPQVGLAWIYTCAPQLYSVSASGHAEGFSTSLVAYILTPQGAEALSSFVAEITQKQGTGYYNFDSDIDQFLRTRGLKNYFAFRNYGEHGGKANPEHRRHGMTGIHRADVLQGQLAFLPGYAIATSHPYVSLFWARLQARTKGLLRLLSGKFLRPKILRTSSVPGRLLRFAIYRQLSLWL